MKPVKNKSRKLALRPETISVLTARRLAEIVGGGTSGPCETQVSEALDCGGGRDQDGG